MSTSSYGELLLAYEQLHRAVLDLTQLVKEQEQAIGFLTMTMERLTKGVCFLEERSEQLYQRFEILEQCLGIEIVIVPQPVPDDDQEPDAIRIIGEDDDDASLRL